MADTGSILGPLENLCSLLAACESWQTWTDADEAGDPAAAALAHVYLQEPPPESQGEYEKTELQSRRPFALVDWFTPIEGMGGQPFSAVRAAELLFVESGRLMLTFEADVPEEKKNSHQEALRDFVRNVEAVVAEMQQLTGAEELLNIHEISIYARPFRCAVTDRETQGDFFRVILRVDYGI